MDRVTTFLMGMGWIKMSTSFMHYNLLQCFLEKFHKDTQVNSIYLGVVILNLFENHWNFAFLQCFLYTTAMLNVYSKITFQSTFQK